MDLALFDFDGTITTREMLPDFIHRAVPPRRLALGRALLAPLVVGYRLGWVPGTVVRAAIARLGFTGMTLADYEAHGLAFAEDALPAVLRAEALARIAWHRARGDTVAVVSGGFDVYLRHWCARHGLDLLCSALEQKNGALTGRYLGRQCGGEEKARRVRAAYDLSRYARIHAYGDTREDFALLDLAHERWYRWERVATTP